MKDLAKLKAACDEVIADPNLEAIRDLNGKIAQTFCNIALQRVARTLGCNEFDGLMADAIYNVMDKNISGKWYKAQDKDAVAHAMSGGLAVAAMTSRQLGEAHGHVAALFPAPMSMSASFGRPVPIVANCGINNAIERESLAFPVKKGEPSYFTWLG